MSESLGRELDWIHAIFRSVRGLSDRSQRAVKIIDALTSRSADEVVQFFEYLNEPSRHKSRSQQIHLDLLSNRHLLTQFSYDQISSVYEIASKKNLYEIQALFRFTPPRWIQGEEKPEAFAQKLDALTLGERKQLSRQMDAPNLEMLIFDEDPQVIASLLQNPKLREPDVVRLASRRGAPEQVLEEVCLSKRWNTRYSVRKALVFNPSTPQAYALGFLHHLTTPDLRLLVQKGRTGCELTQTARRLIMSGDQSRR